MGRGGERVQAAARRTLVFRWYRTIVARFASTLYPRSALLEVSPANLSHIMHSLISFRSHRIVNLIV